ncbi:hypothetical protein ACOMHN_021497 [Nucella lapillus]
MRDLPDVHTDEMRERKALPTSLTPAARGEEAQAEEQVQQLRELSRGMSGALNEAVKLSGSARPYLDLLRGNHSKVKKRLEDHTCHLHQLIDLHHRRQMDSLKTLYQQLLEQCLVARTEEKNYEARLVDLQKQVAVRLGGTDGQTESEGRQRRLTLKELQQAWSGLAQQKPAAQVRGREVEAVLPDVTFADLHGLMGTVTLSQDGHPHSDRPVPHEECPAGLVPHECPDPRLGTTPRDNLTQATVPESLNKTPSQASPDSGEKDKASHLSLPAQLAPGSAGSKPLSEASCAAAPGKGANAANSTPDGQLRSGKGIFRIYTNKSKSKKKQKGLCEDGGKTNKKPHVCKKGPLTEEKKAEGRERIVSRRREMEACGGVCEESERQSPHWVSLTVAPSSSPTLVCSLGMKPAAMAPRPDGRLWMLYHHQPCLHLLDECGRVCQITRIRPTPLHLAAYGRADVLVAHDSPQSLMFYTEGQNQFALFGKCKYKAIAAATSGVVVVVGKGMFSLVFWVPLEGEMPWIRVCPGYRQLRSVASLALLTYKGKLLICAADNGGKVVHFFLQESADTFTAFPPLGNAVWPSRQSQEQGRKHRWAGRRVQQFSPSCVSAHPAGFLAVLDAGSENVYIVDVRKILESGRIGMDCVVSVICGDSVCVGVPLVIAFGVQEGEENPKLWVAAKTGELYISQLQFLSW